MKLGVDTGGTFTDFIVQDRDGFRRYKCPSTPDDPSEAILAGLRYFFPDGIPAELEIIHGTTVGTNAFLERKGGRVLLLITRGFEDVLVIGRQNRKSLFDLNVTRTQPLIEPHLIRGINERLDAHGNVVTPLVEADLDQVKTLVQSHFVDTVVVCFLHSFLNDEHEKRVQELLGDLPVPVLCSVDILPEFREFERCSTAVINGYLSPVMSRYISRLSEKIQDCPLSVQQSNGGVMAAAMVADRAIHTLLSGPAAGVQGAYALATQKGRARCITFDMGGTSTDVSLADGRLSLTKEYVLDDYPVSIPVLDIHTVGAGGGSIAYIDRGGVLQVGPISAGADPGPVCYGKGTQLTVTDANLLLGRLLADGFLGGRMKLDRMAALFHAEKLAEPLGISVVELCLGIIAIVNAGMVKAVRKVSLDRGYDPTDFELYSFGGASGLHCCEIADELAIATIIIPARAGVLSAQGLVFSPLLIDRTMALFLQGDSCTYDGIADAAQRLEAEVQVGLLGMLTTADMVCESFADLRYVGQSYEISMPVQADMLAQFHRHHQQLFGYHFKGKALECVSLRSVAKESGVKVRLPVFEDQCLPLGDKKVVVTVAEGSELEIPVYERSVLSPRYNVVGPCLIIDDYTTILVTASFRCTVDEFGGLLLKKD